MTANDMSAKKMGKKRVRAKNQTNISDECKHVGII